MYKTYSLLIILAILALALPACRPSKVAKGISPEEQMVGNIVSRADDDVPIAHVNGTAVKRGVFTGLAATMVDLYGIPLEQAYQDALNLLIQNALFQQEAERRGYTPTAEEAIQRTREHIEEQKNIPSSREFLEKQAERFGVSLESEEFVVKYAPALEGMMLAERLNQRIDEEVGGDLDQFDAVRRALAADLLSQATIEIVYENLPPEAANIHIPAAEELPVIKNPKPTMEEVQSP